MGSQWGLAPFRIGRDKQQKTRRSLGLPRLDLETTNAGFDGTGFVSERRPVMVWTTRGSGWQSRTSSPSTRRRPPRPPASSPS